jgi:hypothetical protein
MSKDKMVNKIFDHIIEKLGTLSVIIVNGHPNLIRICSYKYLVIIVTMLVQNVHASTHFVAWLMATKIYQLFNILLVGLIGPIKSNPHV